MDTLKVSLLYRGVLYVEVILYSKECNWYTRCCPLNGGVRYRECPLRDAILYTLEIPSYKHTNYITIIVLCITVFRNIIKVYIV